ncbi:hypothetical protein WME94_06090 [Sorangium sp. So ce429]
MTSLHGRAALTAGALLTGGALLMSCAGTLDEDEFPPDEQGSGGGVTQGAGTPAATTGGGGTPAATTGGDPATTTATTGGDPATTTTATTGGGPTGCAEAQALITARCATAGCHDANSKQAGLSLAAGWENTVRGQASACGGGASVLVPGDPDGSTIYTKVTPNPTCNNRMPLGAPQPLSDTEIACIRDFITALPP